MYAKVLIYVIFIFATCVVYADPFKLTVPNAHLSNLRHTGKYVVSDSKNDTTMSDVNFLPENKWIDVASIVFYIAENLFSMYVGYYKNKTDNLPRYCYLVLMNVITQFFASVFSYWAMKGNSNFETLLLNLVGIVFVCNVIYIAFSKFVNHETVFNKNYIFAITFSIIALVLAIIKVWIYCNSPTKDTWGECIKLVCLALLPIGSMLFPLLISIYCDRILKNISHTFPVGDIILLISSYEKLKFDGVVMLVKQNKSFDLEAPSFGIFSNTSKRACILRFGNGDTTWIFKCQKTECEEESSNISFITNVVVIKNVRRICDNQIIDLSIIFNKKDEAEECHRLISHVFVGELPKDSMCCI